MPKWFTIQNQKVLHENSVYSVSTVRHLLLPGHHQRQAVEPYSNSAALDPVDAGIAIAAARPMVEQITTANYWVTLADAGVSAGGTITGTLASGEFPFALTPGNYEVRVNLALFDYKGTIGSLQSTGPSVACDGWGNEITNAIVPVGDLSISPDGWHLQVPVTATDDANCGENIGWGFGQDVSITWQAWVPAP